MVRESLKTTTPLSKQIFGLLLLNALPIAGFVWAGYEFWRGRLTTAMIEEKLGPGAGQAGAICAVSIAGLFVVGSLLLPMAHSTARYFKRSLANSARARAEGGAMRVVFEFLLWPFRMVGFLVFALIRFVLILVALALVIACLAGMVRFVKPEFGNGWLPIEEWVEKLRSR